MNKNTKKIILAAIILLLLVALVVLLRNSPEAEKVVPINTSGSSQEFEDPALLTNIEDVFTSQETSEEATVENQNTDSATQETSEIDLSQASNDLEAEAKREEALRIAEEERKRIELEKISDI